MIKCGDKIKIVKVNKDKMINIWGGYDDISWLAGLEATITSIISPDTPYEKYGVEFEHWGAQVTRERTGYIFSRDEIELVSQ